MAIRVRTNSAALRNRIRFREGVLLRIVGNRFTGGKTAVVRWDGNKSPTHISPSFVEHIKNKEAKSDG